MGLTAEEILEQVRTWPARERLKLVERVLHEVVVATSKKSDRDEDAPWADMEDAEFDAFLEGVARTRERQPIRSCSPTAIAR